MVHNGGRVAAGGGALPGAFQTLTPRPWRPDPDACPDSVSSGGGRPSTGRSRPWRSPAVGGAGVGPVSRSSRRA